MRGAEKLLALRTSRPANRLDAFDPKRFDDGAGHAGLLNHEGITKPKPKRCENNLRHLHRILVFFISDGGCALQFVPGERFAGHSTLNRLKEDQRKQLSISE